jgi:hypothetical protein
LSNNFFSNTLHGPVDGFLNEVLFVVDVLDVDVLTVGEDVVVLLDGNSLQETGVSSSGSGAP